ncbi:nucleotidyl transferase AbiEii/AbiGii toxin family protein [Bacteroides sp.]
MLHLSTVDPQTLELLRQLQNISILSDTRLVGGTALALQIGHRKSIDLDFFGTIKAEKDELVAALEQVAPLTILKDSPRIHIYMLNNVKIDIVDYRYPWIDNVVMKQGIRMASLKDIAAMKITAIVGRGTKKDFIDIAFLLQRFSISNILDFYSQKYSDGSTFMAVKSLAYFDDADDDIMPYMFTDISWETIKRQILSKVSAQF